MEKKLEFLLWRKDDDIGWYISKSSFNIKDFDEVDAWYFSCEEVSVGKILRVGASMYELNWRTV